MRLETLAARTAQPELARELEGLRDAAAEAVERLRSLLVGIQPINLEKNRVSVALGVFLEQAGVEDGLECHLAGPDDSPALPGRPDASLSGGA